MWTFEQHPPRPLSRVALPPPPAMPPQVPRIAIVTPSFNHARYPDATIDSVLAKNYPNLRYHVQDCASADSTVDLLQNRANRISCRSDRASWQSHAINLGS